MKKNLIESLKKEIEKQLDWGGLKTGEIMILKNLAKKYRRQRE